MLPVSASKTSGPVTRSSNLCKTALFARAPVSAPPLDRRAVEHEDNAIQDQDRGIVCETERLGQRRRAPLASVALQKRIYSNAHFMQKTLSG